MSQENSEPPTIAASAGTACSAADLIDLLLKEREARVREELQRDASAEWLRGIRESRSNMDEGLQRLRKMLVKQGYEKAGAFVEVIAEFRHEIETNQLRKKMIEQIVAAATKFASE